MTLQSVLAYCRQTSTILGVAGLAGIAAAVVAKQMTYAEAIPAATAALVAIAMPGHPDTQAAASKAAVDAVRAVGARGTGGTALALGSDLATLAGLLPDNTPVVAVEHQVVPLATEAVAALKVLAATPVPVPA